MVNGEKDLGNINKSFQNGEASIQLKARKLQI